ncbi:MAG: energy-coupling factor transporter ATPase [Clostridia bacterium]
MKGSPLENKAVANVTLQIAKGEFAAIIGHTGSGKSTLIQHLNGLLKPDQGSIIVDGINTRGKDIKFLRKKVGIVFQYPEHQLFEETVYKDIAFGLLKHGVEEPERDRRIRETADMLEISGDLLKKSPHEISGGQKRRVAIAGILVLKPDILILDEPAAGLDPMGSKELFHMVKTLHREQNITVILVSHSMELVAEVAKRIIVMNKGRIVMDGTPEEIFSNAEYLAKIGLSVPQITLFMKELKKKIPRANERIYTVEAAEREILRLMGGGA